MKLHTPIFILGLLTFVTPFLGFPSNIEAVIVAAFGIAIMVISARIKKEEAEETLEPETDISIGDEDVVAEEEMKAAPTYEELTEQVQETLTDEEKTEETE